MSETIDQLIERVDAWLATDVEELFPPPEMPASIKPMIRAWRMKLNGGSHTEEQWEALCAKHGDRCLRCRRKRKLTKDHVVPVAMGGSDDISNLQPLCQQCNSSKGARYVDYRR
jgi:5-methylcytosine-specific restriction endonuclease McrA